MIECKEELSIIVMDGRSSCKHSLSSHVEIESNWHEEDGDFITMLRTVS